MTFQNLLSKFQNGTIILLKKKEKLLKEVCDYLEDLMTSVHIIQLKILTCIRVGNKQKKIDISIPDVIPLFIKLMFKLLEKCILMFTCLKRMFHLCRIK